jgi:hypothetical protein
MPDGQNINNSKKQLDTSTPTVLITITSDAGRKLNINTEKVH